MRRNSDTEQTLKECRNLLRLVQQVGHVGILEWDFLTSKTILSEELKAIYGVGPDFDATLENWEKITPAEDIRQILGRLAEAVAGHMKEYESEYRVIRPDDEIRWLSSRAVIYYDDSGNPVHQTVIAIDITDLKNAQEKLKKANAELERKVAERTKALAQSARSFEEQKELLQTIIDRIPVIVTLWGHYRRLLTVNKEFERLSGWSQEEALNMDIIAASFPDPAYRKEVIRQATKAEPGWGEFLWTIRSGRQLNIAWAAVDLSGGNRVGIGIDITEQRKMEKEKRRLVSAVEQTSEGIDITNLEGIIEYVNPAIENITGYSREEMVGKSIRSLPGFISGDEELEIFNHVLSEAKSWSGRQVRKKKSGEIIDVDVTISPVRSETGKLTETVSVTKDVTQEVKIQQMMIQSQKMEAIGTLAGGIAHDLNNIFTPILINAEAALEDINTDDASYPLIKEIHEASRMGRELVKQIMTFARPTAPQKKPIDITSTVRGALSLLRSSIPKTIDIRHTFPPNIIEVLADSTQIKQVLMNLGTNAAHAMRKRGGILKIDISCVELDKEDSSKISPELDAGSYVEVDVSDTGEGIDEKNLPHIFDPFFTTKQPGEGTGLGLAVALEIVKGHKGAINVWSKPGKGSVFKVFLPRINKGCFEDRHPE